MKTIVTINPHNLTEEEVSHFEKKETARAVVFNKERTMVGLQYATNHDYHKLPGGGIEEGENIKETLERECKEELGYDIEIEKDIGKIIEYRKEKDAQLQRISYCFIAHIINEQRPLNLDSGEAEAGFQVEWMTLEDAIKTLEREVKEKVDHRNNKYILPRDLSLLKYVKSLIETR